MDQSTLKSGIDTWREYMQAALDLSVEATQSSLNQSIALRERLDQLAAETAQRLAALGQKEQEIALSAAEAYQAQAQAAYARLSKLLNPVTARG